MQVIGLFLWGGDLQVYIVVLQFNEVVIVLRRALSKKNPLVS